MPDDHNDQHFHNLYRQGFVRVAACTFGGAVADPHRNAASVVEAARQCAEQGVGLAVFPELALSGYAIADLLQQDALLDAVEQAVQQLLQASLELLPVLVVGAPLRWRGALYNCALVIHRGRVLGVVPKTYLPNYREFYERRHFVSGAGSAGGSIHLAGRDVPMGTDLLFAADDAPDFVLGVEVCEDLWVPVPPSCSQALAGATVLANLSGSPITVGRARARSLLCQSQSMRLLAAYVYAAAGAGESTTDLSWDGQTSIHENGVLLAASPRFALGTQLGIADVDLELLRQERARMGSYDDCRRAVAGEWRRIAFTLDAPAGDLGLRRAVERFPFVPSDPEQLSSDCYEAYNIQVSGLAQRLRAVGLRRVVIGVSGGLDSTQALLVAARAFDLLGMPRSDILAYTLPGFATGEDSHGRAWQLMRSLGVSAQELDIRPAARQMLSDLGHPYARGAAVYDTSFENVQAGLRTDYLFRLAGFHGGIVIGTGDLSELALGWCTYGVGDQMAHYNVNAGVPKTMIQHLIRWVIRSGEFSSEVGRVLEAIVSAEISPELVPAGEDQAPQSTEAMVGPYALQDFHLFYTLRYGFRPSRIAFLALAAWGELERGGWPPGFPEDRRRAYSLEEIRGWLEVFLQRFFGFAQFKRSAMPDGPKVMAGGALSPRGDWRAPSDGNARAWLEDLARALPRL